MKCRVVEKEGKSDRHIGIEREMLVHSPKKLQWQKLQQVAAGNLNSVLVSHVGSKVSSA